MDLVEEISMSNGLVVEVWDDSRPIADDTTKVSIYVKVKVEVKPEYFAKPEHFEEVERIFGREIYFEYRIERTFVGNREKESFFKELLEDFKKNSMPYLARPKFPAGFAMSKYMDIQKRPYHYRHPALTESTMGSTFFDDGAGRERGNVNEFRTKHKCGEPAGSPGPDKSGNNRRIKEGIS